MWDWIEFAHQEKLVIGYAGSIDLCFAEDDIVQIVELKIEGYRTLKSVSWKPGNLNIIIGPNASGKSNLLKFLELASQSARGALWNEVNLSGGMGAILWNGASAEVVFKANFADRRTPGAIDFDYSFTLKRLGKTSSYVIHRELFTGVLSGNRIIDRADQRASYQNGDEVLLAESSQIDPGETLLSQLANTFGKSDDIAAVSSALNNIVAYQEFRTDRDAAIRQSVVSNYQDQLHRDGQNLVTVLHTLYESDKAFQENIDRAMIAAFGKDFRSLSFPPAGSQRIELGLNWNSLDIPQPATVLSDGTLRFLFLITALSLPKLPSLICIDEPETGLHPSMLPIIAEYAANAAQRTQVVLTTHSVQFLDAFSEYNPTTTVAQLKDGETKLVTLDGEKLAYWLREYSLGSLFSSGELENMAQDALDDSEGADSEELEPVGEDAE